MFYSTLVMPLVKMCKQWKRLSAKRRWRQTICCIWSFCRNSKRISFHKYVKLWMFFGRHEYQWNWFFFVVGKLWKSYSIRIVRHWLAIAAYFPERNVETNSGLDFGRILSKRLTSLNRTFVPCSPVYIVIGWQLFENIPQ